MGKAIAIDREERVVAGGLLELRDQGDGLPKIAGYAAVFGQPSEVLGNGFGTFRELVAPGAFTKTLSDGADVRALLNHDPNFVLGRTKNGTLTLREDERGLAYEVTPPDTQWARDLVATMRRGDITQSSFGFQTVRDRWGNATDPNGKTVDERTLLEVRLFDVSPVTFPAYPQTQASIRSLLRGVGLDLDALDVDPRSRPFNVDQADLEHIRRAVEVLRRWLPTEPALPSHSPSADSPEPTPTGHSVVAALRQRLELLLVE